jgi:transposase
MKVATQTSAIPSYEELIAENRFLQHENSNLKYDVEHLAQLLRLLKRQRFAPTSEITPPGQGTLFDEAEVLATEDEAAPKASEDEAKKKERKRGKPVRKSLPKDLPSIDTLIDIPENEKFCPKSGDALVKIGEEITEQLDLTPAKLFVQRTIRPKYICKCALCQAGDEAPSVAVDGARVTVAALPAQPIPKSFASPGLLAAIATAKYADALPLYRQESILARSGANLTRQTIAGWMVRCGEIVKPLINLAKDELLSGPVILCDETRVQVLKGTGKKPTAKSYMWCFMSGTNLGEKVILYELGPSRGHEVPARFLEDYEGYLHTDGYSAYETLAAVHPKIRLVGDWVHTRRKFDEAIKAFGKDFKGEIKVKAGLAMINELFRIERSVIPEDAIDSERHRLRQELSRPLTEQLKAWADTLRPTVRPKSLSGVALNYMLERWPKLILFLEDPILGLDTNDVENAIRPFVTGRKNWLFSASVAGAESSAALYSLVSMARAYRHNPLEYLKAVFTEIPRAKTLADVEKLLPWNWQSELLDNVVPVQQTAEN